MSALVFITTLLYVIVLSGKCEASQVVNKCVYKNNIAHYSDKPCYANAIEKSTVETPKPLEIAKTAEKPLSIYDFPIPEPIYRLEERYYPVYQSNYRQNYLEERICYPLQRPIRHFNPRDIDNINMYLNNRYFMQKCTIKRY